MSNAAIIQGQGRQAMIPNGIDTSANYDLNHLEIPQWPQFQKDAK